jgi:hypothetical protein
MSAPIVSLDSDTVNYVFSFTAANSGGTGVLISAYEVSV